MTGTLPQAEEDGAAPGADGSLPTWSATARTGGLAGPQGSVVHHLTVDRRVDLLRAAARAFLRGDLDAAEGSLVAARRSDPLDPAPLWGLLHADWVRRDLGRVATWATTIERTFPSELPRVALVRAGLRALTPSGDDPAPRPGDAAHLPPVRPVPVVTEGGSDDALLVLGALLRPDGRPGRALRSRLAGALAVAGPSSAFVVSGGNGRAGTTEAEAMARWLEEHGVDPARVVLEPVAANTIENALEGAGVLADHGLGRVTVVTGPDHARRAAVLVQRAVDLEADRLGSGWRCTVSVAPVLDGRLTGLPGPDRDGAVDTVHDLVRLEGAWTVPGVLR